MEGVENKFAALVNPRSRKERQQMHVFRVKIQLCA